MEFFGELLQQQGMPCATVYGTMDQTARQEQARRGSEVALRQVARFRKKQARILVTTDVAARGVDIPLLDHVLNFDFPSSAKLFIHRQGLVSSVSRLCWCRFAYRVEYNETELKILCGCP